MVELFCLAVSLYVSKEDWFPREDMVDSMLSCYIFNLTARKVIALGQLKSIILGDVAYHAAPYLCFYIRVGLMKLNLEEKPALKGFIKIARQVGGGNEYAIQILQFLKNCQRNARYFLSAC